ncbi:MAG: 1-acyl-sn-glycerol-3-phosphate acyltransferase [Chloroflexi bacterium]|nr:1-acyl-sn-glycerol-3-phosphate acyltransferase [Chloroflexota bacterium]MBI1856595.1 1-acyl-sn-glycerol-3-phosphate acyltransferase [Chloroflexota bacterium]MBI3340410.1 1-acyl-sn-glycerol-3-phosphate acyltransferase [Chloroflexota bacterium]
MNKKEYQVSPGLRVRRIILKMIVQLIFRIASRVKMTGLENIPHGRTYMVAANHVSIFDPPLALAFWPEMLEAIGASDAFFKPFQGELLRFYGAIPVHRGEIDRELIETMLAILRSGRPLMIAPEGTRSHVTAMQRAKPGVGYILNEAGVPILPVAIIGTTANIAKSAMRFQRPLLEIRIGRPIQLPPIEGRGAERRAARQRNADIVMRHIAGLLPPEYRGVYADSAIISS